ncbi:MAG: DUF2628 domain-containing protein [Hyphomicrobiales bacterium]
MASYRVFELPHALPQERAAGEDVRFIRDCFLFSALIFPAVWLLWHRLWISFVVFILLMTSFIFIADIINPALVVFLNALVGLYLGFEGANLKAIKLKNSGWHEVGVVIANDEEEAEMRFFSKRANESAMEDVVSIQPTKPKRPIRVPHTSQKPHPIIGGFPTRPAGSRS